MCYLKDKRALKIFIGFQGQIGVYENINHGYTILEKIQEDNKISCKWSCEGGKNQKNKNVQ